jgi:hypothetical protein
LLREFGLRDLIPGGEEGGSISIRESITSVASDEGIVEPTTCVLPLVPGVGEEPKKPSSFSAATAGDVGVRGECVLMSGLLS